MNSMYYVCILIQITFAAAAAIVRREAGGGEGGTYQGLGDEQTARPRAAERTSEGAERACKCTNGNPSPEARATASL